ncbi:MAG: lipid-A-disaccharide synthase N-terminal domain-containing protein [Desulfobulbaceae bacterium]|nr:lipid-A-disaccharide synthase N-terminal domain-containing protein [Desulfobulbaceae bacterium]
MNQNIIFGIGFLAQILFSARMLVQWIYSEKAGRVLSPVLFWQLSIFASFLLIVYGFLRRDIVIIAGQSINYCIYIRNLHYQKAWDKIPVFFRWTAIFFPLFSMIWLLLSNHYSLQEILFNKDISSPLLAWGAVGQSIFTFRFIYQWICMEKSKASLLPLGFWIISIVGSAMILVYGLFRHDPVLILGQVFGVVVYGRNILLYRKAARVS